MLFYATRPTVESAFANIINAADEAIEYDGSSAMLTDLRQFYYTGEQVARMASPGSPEEAKIAEFGQMVLWHNIENSIANPGSYLSLVDVDAEVLRKDTWTAKDFFDAITWVTTRPGERNFYRAVERPVMSTDSIPAYLKQIAPRFVIDERGTEIATGHMIDLTEMERRFLPTYADGNQVRIGVGSEFLVGYRWGSPTTTEVLTLDLSTRKVEVKTVRGLRAVQLSMDPHVTEVQMASKLKEARETWRNEVLAGRRHLAQLEREEAEKKKATREASLIRFRHHRAASRTKHTTDLLIDTLPIQNRGTKSSRRWGIEIETGAGRDLSGTPSGWQSKGDGSLTSAYTTRYIESDDCDYASEHEAPEYIEVYEREQYSREKGWYTETAEEHNGGEPWEILNENYIDPADCDYCGDVETDWDSYDDEDCVELVSPILTSFHSNGLKRITDDLGNAPVTDSAGIHVHVEAKDLTVEQIRTLVLAYDHLEPLIEASYRREERGYCKRRAVEELLEIARRIRDNKPTNVRDMPMGDRYVTVNLQSLSVHGTVEFRAMGPVYNYHTLVRWAMFCREMVNSVANGASIKEWSKVKDWKGVESMFRKYGHELNRAEKTTTSPRVLASAQV